MRYEKTYRNLKGEFGRDVVIACDTGSSWRREWFPHYKAIRKKMREDSPMDWEEIFSYFAKLKVELQEHTNYKVIEVDRAEADDIIGYFAHKNGVHLGQNDPLVIISGDKDFIQLQTYTNVVQYDPVSKKRITRDNPELYLIEHIIRGDKGDGIPNCLSADDTFVSGKRQVTLTKKRFDALFASGRDGSIEEAGWFRNKTLIDLTNTPQTIKDAIQAAYDEESSKPKKSLLSYFTKYRLSTLLDAIGDF